MRQICIIIIALSTTNAYGLDWVFQSYLPSVWGFVSGKGASIYQFEDREIDNQFILPFELRIAIAQLGPVALSGNSVISLYLENDELSSLNISLGMSISRAKKDSSPLQGLYLTLYPVYEFPAFAFGKKPATTWKAASDIGFGFNLFSTPLYFSIYSRLIYFWINTQWNVTLPDFGITLGWHGNHRSINGRQVFAYPALPL